MPSHQSNRYDQIQWFRSILLPQRASRWKYKSVYKQKKQSVIRNFKGSPKFVNLFTFTFTTFFNRRFYSRCSQMFSYIFFVMNGDARGESKRERENERENERVSVWKREREWESECVKERERVTILVAKLTNHAKSFKKGIQLSVEKRLENLRKVETTFEVLWTGRKKQKIVE